MSKKQAVNNEGGDPKPDRAAVRAAHLAKFTWSRSASADAHLSQAAKHLAARMAIDKFGPNGTARATQKELAKICGTTIRTIRSATRELEEGNYWDVDQLGGANRYTMIQPDERIELWDDEKEEWQSTCRDWDRAKRKWEGDVNRWLKAEAQYLWLAAESHAHTEYAMPIFHATAQRAKDAEITDPYGWAIHVAERAWNDRQSLSAQEFLDRVTELTDAQIAEFATRDGYHTPPPRCTECAAELPDDRTDLATCLDCAWTAQEASQAEDTSAQAEETDTLGGSKRHPRRKQTVPQAEVVDSLTCENGDSTSTSSTPKYVEVPSSPAYAARQDGARCGGSPNTATPTPTTLGGPPTPSAGCKLCDSAGYAVSLDNASHVIHFIPYDLESEYPFACRHSIIDNFAAIKQIIRETDMSPNWTGYGEEIDGPNEYYEEVSNSRATSSVGRSTRGDN